MEAHLEPLDDGGYGERLGEAAIGFYTLMVAGHPKGSVELSNARTACQDAIDEGDWFILDDIEAKHKADMDALLEQETLQDVEAEL